MKVADYVKETRAELKHVSWPTRKQAIMYTVLVIAVSVVVSAILGFLDYGYALSVENFLIR